MSGWSIILAVWVAPALIIAVILVWTIVRQRASSAAGALDEAADQGQQKDDSDAADSEAARAGPAKRRGA